uniref:Transmembrane protein 56-B n=1 Tax=Phallusia mammillata TaxID=59560 RepID=A0A6F9DU77_9ASCI|nr:transmembrane protein 56-B [Phallusia mammillata]
MSELQPAGMYSAVCGCLSFVFFLWFDKKVSPYFSSLLPQFHKLTKTQKTEWHARNSSTLHAAIVTLLVPLIFFFDDNLKNDLVWGRSTISECSLAIGIGFLASDLYLIITDFEGVGGTVTFVIHHGVIIFANVYCLLAGVLLSVAIFRLSAEISTTFVNIRWCLSNIGFKDSSWYYYNGWMMTFAFFFWRILSMPFFYYAVFYIVNLEQYNSVSWPVHLTWIGTSVILDVMNIMWFGKMLSGVKKHLSSMSQKNVKND